MKTYYISLQFRNIFLHIVYVIIIEHQLSYIIQITNYNFNINDIDQFQYFTLTHYM